MTLREKNKAFIRQYYAKLLEAKARGPEGILETARQFTSDPQLLGHLAFFAHAFPNATYRIDDIMAEGDQVFVRERFSGKHEGELNDIPPTGKVVSVPIVACYTIRDQQIVNFWAIANEMDFIEQLDIAKYNGQMTTHLK
jgi:predicted ester cyclase